MQVSIIVPVHNVEVYLRQCLDSIIKQTLKDIEIICVDDCSTDSSNAILKEYAAKDSRIKVMEHAFVQGLSCARNTGLAVAKGKYIGFVDSDDWIEPDTYESALKAMQPGIQLVCWDKIVEPEAGYQSSDILAEYIDNNFRGRKTLSLMEKYNMNVSACTKLYRHSILREHDILFTPGLLHEDNSFNYKYFVWVKDVFAINRHLYHYRKRYGSITDKDSRKSTDKVYDRLLNVCEFYEYLKKYYLQTKYKPVLRFVLRRHFLDEYLHARAENKVKVSRKAISCAREMRLGGFLADRVISTLASGRVPSSSLSYVEELFSVRNESSKKVVTVCGFKFKFKRHKCC